MARPLLVLGNAKSLAKYPFYNYKLDTMGMNIAFRFWHQIGWYPTYYVSLDRNINRRYARDLYFLVINRKLYGIKGFLFRRDFGDVYPDVRKIPEVKFLEDINKSSKRGFTGDTKVTSGSFSIRWGMYLGYKKIYILGIDANYTDLKNKSKITTKGNKLTQTVTSNANYFFDGYQRKGDPLHVSRRKGEQRNQNHLEGFRRLHKEFNKKKAVIVNSNPKSRLKAIFPYEPIPVELIKTEEEEPIIFIWGEVIQRILTGAGPLIKPIAAPVAPKPKAKAKAKAKVKAKVKVKKVKAKAKTKAKVKVKKAKAKPKAKAKAKAKKTKAKTKVKKTKAKTKAKKTKAKAKTKAKTKVIGKPRTGRNFRITHRS